MHPISSGGFTTLAAAGGDSIEQLTSLWLPIVASAAGVWIVSAVAWMAIGHHNNDQLRLPDEDGTMQKLAGIPPGNYGFPRPANRKQCRDPEFIKKWEKGPAGMLSIFPRMNMGKNMALTLLVYLVVSVLIAYVATLAIQPGHTRMDVFRIVGTVGVLSYSFAFIPNNIWFGAYPRTIAMNVLDGVAYGLTTGGIFAALWPMASAPALPVH